MSTKQLNFVMVTNRYGGLGTQKAVDNVNSIIAEAIIGYDVRDQYDRS